MIRVMARTVKPTGRVQNVNILAIDVGTSSVKAAIVRVGDFAISGPIGRAALHLELPEADAAVLDPEAVWSAVGEACRAAVSDDRVEGVGLSCLTPAWLLLDDCDTPLTPIITHLDRRARPLAREVWREAGADFLRSTGNKPLPGGMSGIGCAWLLRHRPELRPRIRRFLHLNSWLALRFTSRTAFDPGNASFTGLFDTMTTGQWSPRWCNYLKVDLNWLPDVVSGDVTLGQLTLEAARHLGVSSGIPVKLGIADTSSAMLAAEVGPGDLLHVVGTTQVLATLAPRPVPSENRLTRRLGVGEAFIHVTHNPVGGVALDWIHRLCFREQDDAEFYGKTLYSVLERQSEVVLDPPFLGGDRLEIEPTSAGFRCLHLTTDRLDLLAAVLQAMRKHHQSALTALGRDGPVRRLILTGGAAEVIENLIPEYRRVPVVRLVEGSLRGVAALFR
ncbi:MAG: FGGY-family carbohydrate kinase [Gemmatales bacterium]|nr:FGGY-family carbohydrate kinase [Gemmatales bacterium]MDW8387246.1 FGGY-family carbohydrate kinase [Gemmatales bacterium]